MDILEIEKIIKNFLDFSFIATTLFIPYQRVLFL